MGFTHEDLAKIEKALEAGELLIELDGFEFNFRSSADLMDLRVAVRRELETAAWLQMVIAARSAPGSEYRGMFPPRPEPDPPARVKSFIPWLKMLLFRRKAQNSLGGERDRIDGFHPGRFRRPR